MQPMIEVRGLTKSFKEIQAVRNVSFDVAQGECFGLLGPNGAGKSTIIKILITMLSPDSGEAKVNGFSLIKEPARIRESIGYVPQSLSVDGSLTGLENLTASLPNPNPGLAPVSSRRSPNNSTPRSLL